MKVTEILGIKINHELTINDAVALIDAKMAENTFFQICTTNPEFIVDAQKDNEFKTIINDSFLSLADGSGVVFALDYLNKVKSLKRGALFPLRSFIAGMSFITKVGKLNDFPPIYGVDLTNKLFELCNEKGYTVGLVGGQLKDKRGRPVLNNVNIAKEAAAKLKRNYPNLKVVFADSNIYANPLQDETSVSAIKSVLSASGMPNLHIDMLFVAFGHNRQEKWIKRNNSKLPVKLCIGIGGTLDDIAGYTVTPSDFYSKNNLRWLYRLTQQPWRIKRILKATLLFPFLVFLVTLKKQ